MRVGGRKPARGLRYSVFFTLEIGENTYPRPPEAHKQLFDFSLTIRERLFGYCENGIELHFERIQNSQDSEPPLICMLTSTATTVLTLATGSIGSYGKPIRKRKLFRGLKCRTTLRPARNRGLLLWSTRRSMLQVGMFLIFRIMA